MFIPSGKVNRMVSIHGIVLLVALAIAPLSADSDWVTLPNGMVLVKQEKVWVLYSATRTKCNAVSKRNIVLQAEHCVLVDPRPVGYYKGDPTDPKNYNLKLYPLTKRTWNHGKNVSSNR
jgi:hypothetical protein